jgi:hypothetical protein
MTDSNLWQTRSLRLLVAIAVAVVIVVAAGALVLSLSGPTPPQALPTSAVGNQPGVVMSQIVQCSQSNGVLRASGTTTAMRTVSPTIGLFGAVGTANPLQGPPVQLATLRPGQSKAWTLSFSAQKPVLSCGVATMSGFVPGSR